MTDINAALLTIGFIVIIMRMIVMITNKDIKLVPTLFIYACASVVINRAYFNLTIDDFVGIFTITFCVLYILKTLLVNKKEIRKP